MTTRRSLERAGPLEQQLRTNLVNRRKALGLTQVDVSDLLAGMNQRLPQQTIAKIESGERSLRIDEAAQIAIALGSNLATMMRTERPVTATTLRARIRARKREVAERERNLALLATEYEEASRIAEDLGQVVAGMRMQVLMGRADIDALSAELQEIQPTSDTKRGHSRGKHQAKG